MNRSVHLKNCAYDTRVALSLVNEDHLIIIVLSKIEQLDLHAESEQLDSSKTG